ncbi:Hypothetical protein PHPALM_15411 [Phytophthora palmivora]|uniref:Pol protein n=1 Tax=Phytophthora palmivora TaxID=4796 RepID=A0A2P4XS84_9STRA|nr:Hypothetical protein PHPALM_15411 [Phytophthora palmivora]
MVYDNIGKRVFAAEEIKALVCFVSRVCVRADPGKVKAIAAWLTSRSQNYIRKWLDLANYLHKYIAGCFRQYEGELIARASPGLAGRKQVIQRLQAAESCRTDYPVYDKELLAMKYALVEFRGHILGPRPCVIYTDHAALRAVTNLPHLSQRMARWLSFFAEYNFRVEYKPGKLNVLADALSRRPDYELAHVSRVRADLYDRIRLAYQEDENYTPLVQFLSDGKDAKVDRLSPRQRAQLHRYELADGLLPYRVDPGDPPRVVVPNDEDQKYDILLEAHDVQVSGHLGREKTYPMVSQTFWWPRMYKWVAHYVKTCETCQRVKPSGHASAPLQSPPVPADCLKSTMLDFVFGLPADDKGNTGILVFVCRLSKMVHLALVRDKFTGK